ncbi:GNAT family N-acetyltransferase [Nocardioidaceae bacterium SCSIO 66511]|nr:GNAT family N-acetyltransferase [Nocardioidaceae bacterium SCSIO 66511]
MTGWTSVDDATSYARRLLEGERVRLRPLREEDLRHLETWWAEPAISVLQQHDVRPRPEGSELDTFRRWSANDVPGQAGFCVVRRDEGTLLGHVTIFGADPKNRAGTFAIVLGPEHLGQGYGTEAVRLMVRYGFSEMGLHRIGLQTYAFNDRALATYAKAGFVEEGRRREAIFHDGEFHDEVQLGLLESEWRTQR